MRRALLGLILLAGPAWAGKAFPPPPRSYVLNEGVISPAAESRLSAELSGFERATGHQFVVALFQSLDGESVDDYSNRLFRAWRIGDAKRDDGLLFCLFLKDRRWRVEVGYGLEGTLTDLEAAEIARGQGAPRFQQGDFDGGVEAVAAALEAKIRGVPGPAARTAKPLGSPLSLGLSLLSLLVLGLFPLIALAKPGTGTIGRRAGRGGWGGGGFFGGGWGGGGFGGGGFGGGGFFGGGGSSGGGGASGGW